MDVVHGQAWGRLVATGAIAIVVVSLAACSPRVTSRGNLPDADLVQEIKTGVHSKEEVALMLGTPSSTATFDDNTWYYISNITESLAFFEPKVVDQQVLAVSFDDSGTVAEINKLTLADGEEVQISQRRSPTRGKEMTLLQQLYKTLLKGRSDVGTNEGFAK